ncbi:MAG: DUF2288 family protein [Halobacteriovoraceae bacterium]|nr:DUF2288 family protein [Halobacteriovoraceae bacterium]
MNTLIEKLEKDVDKASWDLLAPYFAKGLLLFVEKELDLCEVGQAVAQDDIEKVKNWQKNNLFIPVSSEQASIWSTLPKDSCFCHFIIVQPFVLIQEFTQN